MNYIATILKKDAVLKLTYKNKLLKIEIKKGILDGVWLQQIGNILPPYEHLVEEWQGKWAGKILYQKERKEPSAYQQFLSEWFGFYERQFGFAPKFTGADGKALQQIIHYLQQVSTQEEAFATWQFLLHNWQKWDSFHQKNTDLKYINSQLNKLLQNAKQGNNTSKQTLSEDFQQEILRGLFS